MDERSGAERGGGESDRALQEHLWVLRAQLGDLEALTKLVGTHQGRVLQYLSSILGSKSDAEDALQDVWITVVRKISKLEDPRAFRAWLYRIARNRAISSLRKGRREDALFGGEVDTSVAEADRHPAAPASEDEDAGSWTEEFAPDAVRTAMEGLSPAHREVIGLRYFQGFSYQEISEIASCSMGTVRSRIHYAKEALRKRLIEPRQEAMNQEMDT